MKFCPRCARTLVCLTMEGRERLVCSSRSCGYIFWNNPVPVVAGIVETSEGVILAHNKLWPSETYSMVSGFLEDREAPEEGIIREIHEELGLEASKASLVGIYPYSEKNQLVLVYHVRANGRVSLGDEIDAIRVLSRDELQGWPFGQDKLAGWPFGAGWAIRDWLEASQTREFVGDGVKGE